jgi:hypothetical protein
MKACRDGRNAPIRANAATAMRMSHRIDSAANPPTGARLIARMVAIARTNLTRASARWIGLSTSM